MIYLDSCALIKLIVREADTDALIGYLADSPNEELVVSEIARTEIRRVIRRRACNAQGTPLINQAQLDKALNAAATRLAATAQITVDTDLLERAAALEVFNIKTLDAIHLASAIMVSPALTSFVTYDKRLREHAEMAGLKTVVPQATP